MPVEPVTKVMNGVNKYFYRWGKKGKEYMFDPTSPVSRDIAYDKAMKQGRAVFASKLGLSK